MDTSFLSIDPDVLTADVGAKAHFSCQGNAINQISIQGTTRGNEPQLIQFFNKNVNVI